MNSLRVDLIDVDLERRSASPVRLRFLVKMTVTALAVCILTYGTIFVVKVGRAERERRAWSSEWTSAEPKLAKALVQRTVALRNKAILAEIRGWNKCRVDWAEQLVELRRVVPEDIQLTSLMVADFMKVIDSYAGRDFTMALKGKARGKMEDEPQADVGTLEARMQKDAFFEKFVDKATVVVFDREPGADAARHWRIFEIAVNYKTRKFLDESAPK